MRTQFFEKGEERKEVLAYGYQNDEQKLGLRPDEWQYVMPGSYEFRAEVNNDNHLSITETLVEGDKKDLVFNLVNTVKVKFITTTSMDNVVLKFHSKLYQDGEEKYNIHRSNGKVILPRSYDVHLGSNLIPHIARGVVVSAEENQIIEMKVPVGILKLDYVDQGGSVMDVKDKRLWLSRIDSNGKLQRDRLSRADVKAIYLMEGRYHLKGWSKHGNFEEVEVDLKAGETKSIQMRDRG